MPQSESGDADTFTEKGGGRKGQDPVDMILRHARERGIEQIRVSHDRHVVDLEFESQARPSRLNVAHHLFPQRVSGNAEHRDTSHLRHRLFQELVAAFTVSIRCAASNEWTKFAAC